MYREIFRKTEGKYRYKQKHDIPESRSDEVAQPHQLLSVTKTEDVLIQEDGNVHYNTWCDYDISKGHKKISKGPSSDSDNRRKNTKRRGRLRSTTTLEDKAVSNFAIVIYDALDHGLGSDQERRLSPNLEEILECMMADGNKGFEADEGIESDQFSSTMFCSSGACTKYMQVCSSRLSVMEETHFRAVCRALVTEALQLSTFMQNISKYETDQGVELLQEMELQDWARLWVQVMHDLRTGVGRLKHVEHTKTAVEYELTPYEMLMGDIRYHAIVI